MKNIKVSVKLSLSFLIVLGLTIIVGTVGILGMIRINSGSQRMFEHQTQPLVDLGMAREYFHQIRVQLSDIALASASGNLKAIDLIEQQISEYEYKFLYYMKLYKATIIMEGGVEGFNEILEGFEVHQLNMRQVIASARAEAPPVQMMLMMDNLTIITDRIFDALTYTTYRRVLQAVHANAINRAWFDLMFILIIIVISASIITALFLIRHISKLISRPISEIGHFAERVSKGDIALSSISSNTIDVQSTDEIGDLARILEDAFIKLSELDQAKTEIQRLEAKNVALDAFSLSKTEFLSNISHEFRTPLTVISGYAQLTKQRLEKGIAGNKEIKNQQTIFLESRRLSTLVKTLLDISIVKGGLASNEYVSVKELTERMKDVCKPILEKNHNRLAIKIKAGCPPVRASHDTVLQVIVNLVVNASRHDKNGVITITIKRADDMVSFSVQDSGAGIPTDMMDKLFERGVSGSGSTGLGLTICKETVEAYGGTIAVRSSLGKGTRVIFTLPAYKNEAKEVN